MVSDGYVVEIVRLPDGSIAGLDKAGRVVWIVRPLPEEEIRARAQTRSIQAHVFQDDPPDVVLEPFMDEGRAN